MWAVSDATFRINGVGLGPAVQQGTLARVLKLGGNALMLHEVAFLVRTFGAERTLRSLGLVLCAYPVVRAGRVCGSRLTEELHCRCWD